MKKLILLLLVLLTFTSCKKVGEWLSKEDTVIVKNSKDDFLYIPDYDDDKSYWFVVVESKDTDQKFNLFMEQDHKYFSEKELKSNFNENIFVLNIVQINKETYDNNRK
jgi:hypothetical protein